MISVKFRAIPSAANDDYFREGLKDWAELELGTFL